MTTLTSFPIETKTVSELTASISLEDTDLIHVDQGGVDKKYTGALLKQVMTDHSTIGGKCVDSGVANAYILSPLSGRQVVSSLQDGMRFYATALNANTGASTIVVHGSSALPIVDKEGVALVGGEIDGDFEVEYDSGNTRFRLLDSTSEVKLVNSGTAGIGYWRLWSDGTIEQWGGTSVTTSSVSHTFPIAFVAGVQAITGVPYSSGTGLNSFKIRSDLVTLTSFGVIGDGTHGMKFYAIGK